MTGDIYSFGNYTFANLIDPSPWANVRLEYMNIPLALTNNFWTTAQFAPINPVDIHNSYTMPPVPFGLEMYGIFADPTNYSDGTLRNFDIGLSGYNNKITMESLAQYGINPAKFALGGVKFGNFGTMSGINFTKPTQNGNVADDDKADKSDKAVFERKVKLILECGDYKDEIAEIRKAMKNDYKKGIAKLDELMKEIDSDKLNEAAKKLYEKDLKSKTTSADKIAEQWAEVFANGGTDANFKVVGSSLTKDNVLDVIGSYMRNEKFQTGTPQMWTPLINNNFEAISKALYAKADDLKKSASDADKAKIEKAVKGLKDADESTRPAKCQELFMTLRGIQAAANDKKAAERYGVPADKADTGVKDAQNTFNAEQNAWNEASKKIKVQG